MAAVILAMAVGAMVIPFAAGAQTTAQDARMTLAVNLAQSLMEEILNRPCSDPDGSQNGETGRFAWDDMLDYNNYTETENHLVSFDTTLVRDGAATGLSRKAFVVPDYVAGQDPSKPANFLRITVEMYWHNQLLVRLSRLVYLGT